MAELRDTLRADPHLAALPEDALAALEAAFEVERFGPGPLVAWGQLLLVLAGEVDVRGTLPQPGRAGRGTWLGGLPDLDTGAAPVTAADEGQAARLSLESFRSLDAPVRAALLLSLGAQLARAFRAVTGRVRQQVGVGSEAVTKEYDVVVIGAGPHAVSYAVWIKQDRPETRIALVDKRTTPGFKIGESTLGPVVRAAMSMRIPLPAMRRLFNNKLGLHFWWMDEDSDELHMHVDHVVEETFQIERRVWETLYLAVARRAGIDVHLGTRALIEESRIAGQPKELVCETVDGDVIRFRSKILCDASGPAAVIGRSLGIRHKKSDFNTNAYWGYFRKKADVDLPTWDVAATRHLCFPEGWVWFIELASWQQAPDEKLEAMVGHLLDIGSPDEAAYPTRFELAEQYDCPVDQWPISIGVVPRTDIDTASDLPLDERFYHYVSRYPVFKRIMDTYELIEEPYPGHPSWIAYTEITQHSDRYAGDGWLLIGDAAYFVNPLYSPGLTYGHSLSSFAARETVSALARDDYSEGAFAAFDEGARGLFSALVSECEMWYRSFRHVDAYERAFHLRVAYFIGLQHERIQMIGGAAAMRHMIPIRPMGPPAEPIMDPRYTALLAELIGRMRELEARGADAIETAAAVKAVIDPVVDEMGDLQGVAALQLGQAFQYYDDNLRRVPRKEPWDSLVPTWRCSRCDNRNLLEFERCYVCGDPPSEADKARIAAAPKPERPPGPPR